MVALYCPGILFRLYSILLLAPAAGLAQTIQSQENYGIQQPKLLQKAEPECPPDFRGTGLHEVVLVRATIDSAGIPRDPVVVRSSNPVLDEPAMAAVKKSKYAAGRVQGTPRDLAVLAEVEFRCPSAERSSSAAPVPRRIPDPAKEEPKQKQGSSLQSHEENADSSSHVSPTHDSASAGKDTNKDVEFFGASPSTGPPIQGAFRLRTENFVLISDYKDNDQLGQVLLSLERARSLFLHLYGKVPKDSVMVAIQQDLREIQRVCKTVHGVGCYTEREAGRPTIFLSRAFLADGPAGPAVHEYTHLIQREMGYSHAPAWVNEGIATYYENIEFRKDKLYVGYFNPRRVMPSWLHAETILAMDYSTLNQSTLQTTQAFYAQSHLLIHMLRNRPSYNSKLTNLLRLTRNGVESRDAFREVYGINISQLSSNLVDYYRGGEYQKVEVFENLKVPQVVTADDGSGIRVSIKEKKCTWCGVENVMRRVPIFVPIR